MHLSPTIPRRTNQFTPQIYEASPSPWQRPASVGSAELQTPFFNDNFGNEHPSCGEQATNLGIYSQYNTQRYSCDGGGNSFPKMNIIFQQNNFGNVQNPEQYRHSPANVRVFKVHDCTAEERPVCPSYFTEDQQRYEAGTKIKTEARESCFDMEARDNLSTILSSTEDMCGDDFLNNFDYSGNYGDILDPDIFQTLIPKCISDATAYPISNSPQVSTPQYAELKPVRARQRPISGTPSGVNQCSKVQDNERIKSCDGTPSITLDNIPLPSSFYRSTEPQKPCDNTPARFHREQCSCSSPFKQYCNCNHSINITFTYK